MESIPLIPESKFNSNPDTSHVLSEEFQEFLGHGEFPKKIAENLSKFNSEKYDLKYCGTEVNNVCNYSKKYYEDITNAEYTVLKTQAKYLQEKSKAQKCPLKMKTYLPNFEESIVEKYSLIQPKDLLPHDTEQILNCRLDLKNFPARKSCNFIEKKINDAELMTNINCPEKIEQSKLILFHNSANIKYKQQFEEKLLKKHGKTTRKDHYNNNQTVFLARPKKITFFNYQKHVSYEKHLFLLNVSTKPQLFKIPELPAESNFRISVVSPIHKVAPGMCAKFTIHFTADTLVDCHERLVIRVPGSQAVVVDLRSCRDVPVVKGLVYSGELALYQDKLASIDVNSALNYTIDCGTTLLGYGTEVTFVFRNYGGKGTFFILGEEDWVYREVHSIDTDFKMTLTDFTISPVYFELNTDEIREIKIEFQPAQRGVCLEKVYILCDNAAYKEIDLIGDCQIFEASTIQFNVPQEYISTTSQIDNMKYSLDMGKAFARQKKIATFFVRNTSNINVHYECRKWTPCECDCEEIYLIEDDWIHIQPSEGMFKPFCEKHIEVSVCVDSKEPGIYVYVLCLYALNLPKTCLNEDEEFKLEYTKENCHCGPKLCNVALQEIEIQIEIVDLNVQIWPVAINFDSLLIYETESNAEKFHITNNTPCEISLEWAQPKTNDYKINFYPESFTMQPFCSTICTLSVIPCTYNNIETQCTLKINLDEKKIPLKAIVERPKIKISESFVNFGIVREDSEQLVTLRVVNQSKVAVYWDILEYKFDFYKYEFVEMTDSNVDVNCGELCHQGSYCDVTYRLDTSTVQTNFSILIFFITYNNCEKFESGVTFILADVQVPDVQIQDVNYKENIFQINEIHYQCETLIRDLYLHNYSPFETSYTWGEPCGLNKNALSVKFDYNSGKLYGNSRKKVEITVSFREIGCVKDFYIPCSIEALEQPVFLQICLQIKAPEIVFSIPVQDGYIEVVWQNAYPKYERYEEYGVLEEQQVSVQEYSEQEDQQTNINSTKSSSSLSQAIIQVESDKIMPEDSKILQFYPEDIISYLKSFEIEAEYEYTESSVKEVTPSEDQSTSQSDVRLFSAFGSETSICENVVEFYNVPCKQIVKKSMDITNNMKIALRFDISVKNFKAKSLQRTKFESILVNMKLKHDNTYTDQLSEHGIFVTAQPENGRLNEQSTVNVEFNVYAETWGMYLEEVAIEIQYLPTFYLNLVIHVVGYPLEYPVLRNNNLNLTEPIVQFNLNPAISNPFPIVALMLQGQAQKRIITLYNSSTIPCTVVWHLFTKHIEDELKGPLNIMIDIFNTSQFENSVECKLRIIKYFGRQRSEEFDLFTIEPNEVYIEAKETKFISLTINPRLFQDILKDIELHALLVGHVYIDKIYRNFSNFIIRNPDRELKTTKIPIFAHIECLKQQIFNKK